VSIPKTVGDALAHLGWRQAMLDKISSFQNSGTWELIPLPYGTFWEICCWLQVGFCYQSWS